MNRFTNNLLLLLLATAIAGAEPGVRPNAVPPTQREVADFDFDWRFAKGTNPGAEQSGFDDSGWRSVTLPHDWSIEDLEPLPDRGPILNITKGTWRFSQGDNQAWKASNFDDSTWAEVQVPAQWENPAKDESEKCYGWYRRKLELPAGLGGKALHLAVGWIRDADQTFVNGVMVGSTGAFPPNFVAAAGADRYYAVPAGLVKGDGTDVVAVRVYHRADGYGGGIYREQTPHLRSGPFDNKAPNGTAMGYSIGGAAWYRKRFTVPGAHPNDRVRIQFDGVYMNADVWINGNKLGNHPYGYTSFGYDLTPHLRPGGENVIAVEVKTEGAHSRWYSGAGIYRHVRLIRTGPVHVPIWGTYITTPDVSEGKAVVRVRTQVTNTLDRRVTVLLRTTIQAADGRTVASDQTSNDLDAGGTHEFDRPFSVANPALWSPDAPNLYTAVSEIAIEDRAVDAVTERFGIRTISFDAKEGFKLNGRKMLLKGSCMHHDNGPLGAAAHDDAEYRRVRLTKAAGFNAIRCSHNPPSETFLNACDEMGVLVIDEAFDVWKEGKRKSDFYAAHFDRWWRSDLDSMLLRDRNHPSIIMWSIGNEIPNNHTAPVAATARMLAEHVRQVDPTRPVTSAVQGVHPALDEFFAALDVGGYNYALKWNGSYKYKPNAYVEDHQRKPDRVILGTESFPPHAFDYWMVAEDHPWVIGDFVWTGWDYLGESSIGWRGFGHTLFWPVAYCGDIDITGLRRPQSFYRGVLFGHDKLAAFVQCPTPSFDEKRRFDWGFEDVRDSWTWPGYESRALRVTVYSSCDEVELFLDEKSMGRQPTTREKKFRAGFKVTYQPGRLKAVGYTNGKALSECVLETVGQPAEIRLRPERVSMAADGKSLTFVPFDVVDAAGRVHPNADHSISFRIEGPGHLAAFGNGDPSSVESFQQPQHRAWRGQGLAIVKSTRTPGPITLTATGDGLKPATVRIETK